MVVVVVAGGTQRTSVPVPLARVTLPAVSMAVMTTVITATGRLVVGPNAPTNGPTVPEYSSSTFDSGPPSDLFFTEAW